MILEGKVALVTGAGAGIGRAISVELVKHGAKVIVNDLGCSIAGVGHSTAPAEETVALCKAAGGEAHISVDSVSDWDGAHRMVQKAFEIFGRLDVVINSAGNLRWSPIQDMSPQDWLAIVDTHLNGAFYLTRAAIPRFIEQKQGAFVHMTSTSALIGNENQAHYCAAKAGVTALSKAIALEMRKAQLPIRSNCIAPFANTRMATTIAVPAERHSRLDLIKPEHIAPLAVYLASEAARDVNGQIFTVRGNEIMIMQQMLPAKSVHRGNGWTFDSIQSHAMPSLKGAFVPVQSANEVFSWLPI